MNIEEEIKKTEARFNGLENKRQQLIKDQQSLKEEQLRLQGEYRCLTMMKGAADEQGA